MVVTVVDMIPELMPELFPGRSQHLAKEAYVRQAAGVVCISESTRRDLLQVYGPLEAAVAVAHLAVGPEFRPGIAAARRPAGDYLLFVGNRSAYKDFPVALDAFTRVHHRHPDLSLVAVGGGPFTKDERAAVAERELEGVVQQLNAADADLPGLFGSAEAFLFPSRYEGFGLPTLEAMASGTPVVLAESSSHPEVGGEAALYFQAGDAAGLAAQVERLLEDPEFNTTVVARGLENVKRFTWHETAVRTRQFYREVLGRV